MSSAFHRFLAGALLLGGTPIFTPPLRAARISEPIRDSRRVRLKENVPAQARSENDQGPVDPSMVLPSMTLVLKPSPEQQAALDQFLAAQQDPSSPEYHHWLTPEEFGARFGASPDDIQKMTAWLKSHNLRVTGIGRANNWISFTGAARDVENTFGAEIHHYLVNGKKHYANSAEPSVPVAIEGIVRSIRGLNDFRMKPRSVVRKDVQPNYTSPTSGNHYLAPDDVATIYNIKPLYAAGVDGSGQKIVIVGQTRITLSDIQQFRSRFNLPANDPQVVLVPNTMDPGIIPDDQAEADLDLEMAGAVARNATLIYVYSPDVGISIQYAIDQNLAPVLSTSYGLCEGETPLSEAQSQRALAKQANAQGMTWFAASGDSGGADCYDGTSRSPGGPAVDVPASIPEVTGVGGTELAEGAGNYWNAQNSANGDSVVSYVPEYVWNDTSPANPSASGGGASAFFEKPSWQTGPGVPNDNARSVPDVSLASSAQHDGYLVYSGGRLQVMGGTSAAAPSLAGITALLNQRLTASGAQASPGVGNINPGLYGLAQTTPSVFHDIVAGDNKVTVTCGPRSRNCTAGMYGVDAGTGYDMATGLGSVDAYQLVMAWQGAAPAVKAGARVALAADAPVIAIGDAVTLTATVQGDNGAVPSGSVTFLVNGSPVGTAAVDASGTATLRLESFRFGSGTNAISAQYAGDSLYGGASASVSVTLLAGVSAGAPSIAAVANGASFRQAFAPGMILTVFGSQLAPATASAGNVPLPARMAGVSATVNGFAAPLFFVSPGQINLQVPFEVAGAARGTVTVSNNGAAASATFPLAPTGPGIFVDQAGRVVPSSTAAAGQVATLFITGAGTVSPSVITGGSPAAGTPVGILPQPLQAVGVTVGGVPATILFSGVPPGLAGVVQINFRVPATGPGPQAVVVTAGGVASPAATMVVTP